MWVDPNLNDFYSRVSRIEKSHAKGYGFEAAGTVGRKGSRGPDRGCSSWRNRWFWRFLAWVKGVIHYYVGAQTYESRVSALGGRRRASTRSEPV
jgi:hypothetical protein